MDWKPGDNPSAQDSAVRAAAPVRVLPFSGSDEELLTRLKSDRRGGAALLHDRFSEEVNRLVWHLLGADQEHDDIVQQVFCKLLAGVSRVRDAEKLRGWVQSVAVNAVYSELRKRGVRRLFMASQVSVPSRFVDGPSRAESRDLLARVYAELDRMPAAERLVFSLRFVEEKPLAEVAEMCECSLATVKRRLQRANKRFSAFAERYPEIVERLRRRSGVAQEANNESE